MAQKDFTMSISVDAVTKIYGRQKALDTVSFEIKTGEIVGYLGPNGAGKSTMMKIITGFLPQTAGTVNVCGIDTREYSDTFRRKIGYLPEHNPLYPEMYIKEYLNLVAGMYKLPNKKARIQEMIELTGLGYEQHKQIGALSKGYRQRVGLAQALIHNPEVLILDEPTTGLDPNQIVEVRNLIKSIGREKTVMLSTHIMQEVEAICERVIIINKGGIVADQKADELMGIKNNESIVEVEFEKQPDLKKLKQIPGVISVGIAPNGFIQLSSESDTDIRKEVFQFAVSQGLVILSMNRKEQGLEEIFHSLTQS